MAVAYWIFVFFGITLDYVMTVVVIEACCKYLYGKNEKKEPCGEPATSLGMTKPDPGTR